MNRPVSNLFLLFSHLFLSIERNQNDKIVVFINKNYFIFFLYFKLKRMLYYKCDKIDILNAIEMRTDAAQAYPIVSCLGLIGTTPALLVRPTVGLMPTTELRPEGHKMEPSVSVPSDTVTKFAATDIADPLLDPQGSPNVYGFCTTQNV